LADDDTEAVFVRLVVTVHDSFFHMMVMVFGVAVFVAIMTGMNPVALAVEVAVDFCPFGAKMCRLLVMTFGFGSIRLVLEAMLDAVTLAIQVLVDPFSL
jgi:hypothetical protein